MEPWPEWWRYEVILSPHALDRMEERGLAETDLRAMLEDAADYRESAAPGRFIIATTFGVQNWEIVVEPDEREAVLVVVTAYRVES